MQSMWWNCAYSGQGPKWFDIDDEYRVFHTRRFIPFSQKWKEIRLRHFGKPENQGNGKNLGQFRCFLKDKRANKISLIGLLTIETGLVDKKIFFLSCWSCKPFFRPLYDFSIAPTYRSNLARSFSNLLSPTSTSFFLFLLTFLCNLPKELIFNNKRL